MKDAELTHDILGVCFDVANELGHGFLEGVYRKALLLALRDAGMEAKEEVPLHVFFRGQCVGHYTADIVVEGRVIIELKAVKALAPEHQAQLINYLNATGLDVGLLVNFGAPSMQFKRCHRTQAHDEPG